ncbi:MAG: folate family ECF transporter S component [Oscillospiraceae bacterium]|nr:folate family ECF transporter S component [Oscillospiraceae bacterium]
MQNISPTPRISKASQSRVLLRKITLSAVFLALALVSKLFLSISLPMLGANGMRIGFAGIFTAFPAILFGPFYGGAVSALSDLLGAMIKPDGAYIPWLTLTAFCGGFIKGLLWRLLTKKEKYKPAFSRSAVGAVLAVLVVFGFSTQLSLKSDGISNSFFAVKDNLPTRGTLEDKNIGFLSSVAVSLAKYNNDTITLSSAPDTAEITIPSFVTVDGYQSAVTKLDKDAFSNNTSLDRITIPAQIKTIPNGIFSGIDGLVIYGKAGSEAQKFANNAGIEFVKIDNQPDFTSILSSSSYEADGFVFKSSDTFRKYLAGYINLITVGFEAAALLGGLIILIDCIIKSKRRSSILSSGNPADNANGFEFLRIFICVVCAGVFVTTINTEILRIFLPAWVGREFLILLLPRIAEEIVINLVHAYFIAILYGVYKIRILKSKGSDNI